MEKRVKAIQLIEKALAESLSLAEATEFLSSLHPNEDEQVAQAVHAAVHFVSDLDIRSKDADYARLMSAQLTEYAKDLIERR